VSEVIQTQIQTWRQRAAAGLMTLDEMREAIAAIRKERVEASSVSAASKERKATTKAKANAAPIDSEALLNQLGGLL
jgi:Arc/MetJ-type ribon-helix-helix transcriptional regulator